MDVERVVAQKLMDVTGVACYLVVPDNRPEEFVTVEQTGSEFINYIETVQLAVQSWANTRRRARDIARKIEAATAELVDEPNIFFSKPSGAYRFPDPESRMARYQTNITVTLCD